MCHTTYLQFTLHKFLHDLMPICHQNRHTKKRIGKKKKRKLHVFITGVCFKFGGTKLSYQYIILPPDLLSVSSLNPNNSEGAMGHTRVHFLLSASQRIRAGAAIHYPTLASKQVLFFFFLNYSLNLLMTKGTPSGCDNHEIISFRGLEDPRGVISSGWPSPLSWINSEMNICIPPLHLSETDFQPKKLFFPFFLLYPFFFLFFLCYEKQLTLHKTIGSCA